MNNLKKLQRKLIPVNFVVAIISLIAALSLVFAPILTIDLGSMVEQIVAMSEEESSGYDDNDYDDEPDDSNIMTDILGSIGDTKISITTYGMAKFAFTTDPIDFLVDAIASLLKSVEKTLVANLSVELIPQLIENSGLASEINMEYVDTDAILESLDSLFNAQGDAELSNAISNLADEIQRQAVDIDGVQLISDEDKEEIVNALQELIDDAKAELGDEKLTWESFICVTISKMINSQDGASAHTATTVSAKAIDDGASSGSDKVYTSYKDLLNGMLGVSEEDGIYSDEDIAELRNMFDMLIMPVKIFAIAMLFFAGIWAIQFLFAFFHMFAKNKRFMMWYTKLFGLYPCLVFGIAPMLAANIIASAGEEVAAIAGILGAITTMTWISGICYALLWLISIFWAFPIKHKIRKALKNGATYD